MTIIYTTKDSDVREDWPTNNYGSAEYMSCAEESGHEIRSLVGFNISSIDVAAVTVATLYVYCYDYENININVHRVTGSWTEGGVTWNTKPAITATNSTSFACTSVGWKSVNVLSMLQDESGSEFGVRLTHSNTNAAVSKFRTKEYDGGSVKAYLSITGGGLTGDKYVDIATGSDSDSGNTWSSAYQTVKKGIDNLPVNNNLHIAEGNYSAQAAVALNQTMNLICEDYGGGNASPPLTVVLPVTV